MTTQQRRSELVRERRKNRRSSGNAGKSRASSGMREMPPMVSRAGTMATPTTTQKRRGKKQIKQRRRYDVAVGTTGAEISFPAVAVPRVGWRVVSFLLLALLGFAFYWLWTSPAYTVTMDRVEVNGLSRIEKSSLLEKAGILNEPVFLIDPGSLSTNLPTQVPALQSVDVSVGLQGDVVFEAVERVPVIAWDQQSIPQVSWVDEDGKIFPAIGSSQGLVYVKADDLPPTPAKAVSEEQASLESETRTEADSAQAGDAEVEQPADEQLLDPELVQGILSLAQALPVSTELVYDGEHGFGWKDPEYEWMVYFGKELDQTDLRIKIYSAIVDMFSQKERKPVLISVEYLHAPYYRMEP